ncbi:MAG: nucleotidyltransferase domain-containing protein [Dermatophilaceae bacterium]
MPLAVVTPTLDAAVLHALAATTARASGARVHRMAGTGSPDGVRKVLTRLVAQGIVLADEYPNATLYLLNRDHVAAEAIVALTRVRTVIIERITDALSRWSPEPVHASLFGSFARGEATTTSDIDILVVISPAGAADQDARATQVDRLTADVLRWTGNRGHIVDPTPDILAAMIAADDPLLVSWRTDHIHLMGTRLLDLLWSVS